MTPLRPRSGNLALVPPAIPASPAVPATPIPRPPSIPAPPDSALHSQVVPKQRMVDVFLRYLKEEGVRYVFAIPGGLLHPLMAAVEADDSLKLIMPKHEEGAAFLADGYARVSGKLAVCAG